MKSIFAAIAFFLLLQLSFAQISLPPVETEFTILPIILTPVLPSQPGSTGPGSSDPLGDLRGDFTGTSQVIALRGNFDYLSVRWNANYIDKSERNIGVRCYLNCPGAGDDIDNNCSNVQKCEYLGLVGFRSCVIPKPNYKVDLPPEEFNSVTCKFYDPANPDLEFRPYPTRSFRTIDYSLLASPVTVTVGEPFNFPLSVINKGLILSGYTVSITEIPTDTNVLSIDRTGGNTGEIKFGEAGRFSPKVIYLVDKSTVVKILANSNLDPVTCSANSQCNYLGDAECVDSRCWKKLEVQLKSGKSSLSEFDVFGFLQIMAISIVVLFFIRRK